MPAPRVPPDPLAQELERCPNDPSEAPRVSAEARPCAICGGDDALWEDVDRAARAAGLDPMAVSRQFWLWFVGRPGSRLPERPPATDPEPPIRRQALANPTRTKI